ncbi:hypothetical protein LTR56_026250, partial [Elasticomyces elasticus]
SASRSINSAPQWMWTARLGSISSTAACSSRLSIISSRACRVTTFAKRSRWCVTSARTRASSTPFWASPTGTRKSSASSMRSRSRPGFWLSVRRTWLLRARAVCI